ncbi:NAD(P)/FAD-dependent oxidoreductase [Candidatus Poribacteria bacterium]|nr:NAD(P)/FAD-dependent oxidoreductase [Candidatus Poribacteria bacterium]
MDADAYDVAVIGAGPAGAQAAISASHQMRHVLVLDAGEVSNRKGRAYWSKSVEFEDVPVFAGITGPKLLKALREWMRSRPVKDIEIAGEVRKAGIDPMAGVVVGLRRHAHGFELEVSRQPLGVAPAETATFTARRVVIASGFEDRWPQIEADESATRAYQRFRAVFRYAGNKRGWHVCIRCDGHLHVNESIAILGVGDYVYDVAVGAQDFTDKITIYTNGRPHGMSEPVLTQISERGIHIDTREIRRHIGTGTDLIGFELADGEKVHHHGFFVDEGLDPNTQFLAGWDVQTDAEGLLCVNDDNQVLDSAGEPVPGIYAAGDIVAGARKLIASAFASGQNAALAATDSLRKWHRPE